MQEIKEIGRRLRQAIESSGQTIADVSRTSGIPQGTVQRYLNGTMEPGAIRLASLARAARCTSDWLLGLPAEQPARPEVPLKIQRLARWLNELDDAGLRAVAAVGRSFRPDRKKSDDTQAATDKRDKSTAPRRRKRSAPGRG